MERIPDGIYFIERVLLSTPSVFAASDNQYVNNNIKNIYNPWYEVYYGYSNPPTIGLQFKGVYNFFFLDLRMHFILTNCVGFRAH